MSVEAMKQALEALEVVPIPLAKGRRALEAAMDTLRQAIEQAEKQEPVAYIEHHKGGDNLRWEEVNHEYAKATPLYTAPPQREWIGLTDEEVSETLTEHHGWQQFAKAIEAKLKEKNHVY
jgi:hypothetical protein